jgi:hypothetical protein
MGGNPAQALLTAFEVLQDVVEKVTPKIESTQRSIIRPIEKRADPRGSRQELLDALWQRESIVGTVFSPKRRKEIVQAEGIDHEVGLQFRKKPLERAQDVFGLSALVSQIEHLDLEVSPQPAVQK